MRRTSGTLIISGIGLVTVLALSACGSGDSDQPGSMGTSGGHGTSSTAATTDARSGDVIFAQMMIPHHEQAIEMADLALQNPSASAQVKALAQQIKAAQGPEIQTMDRWLRQWGAPAAAPMDHGSGMMSDEDMASLETRQGSAFDRTWLTMMIEHHQGAVTMAEDVLSTTSNAEVKTLAQAVVDGQKKEIATMQDLVD